MSETPGNPYLTDFPDNRGQDMTLRDLFAAAALVGYTTDVAKEDRARLYLAKEHWLLISHAAYGIADAMLTVRDAR